MAGWPCCFGPRVMQHCDVYGVTNPLTMWLKCEKEKEGAGDPVPTFKGVQQHPLSFATS